MPLPLPLLLALLALAPARRAEAASAVTAPKERRAVDWLYADTRDGARVLVPVVDADPVRGVTAGLMPVWVGLSSSGLRSLYAPSLTYNAAVGGALAMDYYRFVSTASVFEAFASIAQRSDREVYAAFQSDASPMRGVAWDVEAQLLRDANRRFYGTGPDSTLAGETDYTLATWNASGGVDVPFTPGAPWGVKLASHVRAVRLLPGPRRGLPDIEAKHPGAANVRRRLVDAGFRAALVYDTRDSKLTSSRGRFSEAYAEAARDGFISDMTYERYGFDAKAFHPLGPGPDPRFALAGAAAFERLVGSVPFWSLPSLGGKYSHRGYGEGRFVDQAMGCVQGELRNRVYATELSGRPVSFWADPFVGAGFVAPSFGDARMERVRPFAGLAFRGVVRPQVVGSADFAVAAEGLKVFLDLNYAF